MQSLTLRATPPAGAVLASHIRILLIRFRWELLVLCILSFGYQLLAARSPDSFEPELLPFVNGGLGLPGFWVFALLAGFWSFRVWYELPPGGRPAFNAYPVGRPAHNGIRITAGAAILLATVTAGWLLGVLLIELRSPGSSSLTFELYRGWGMGITLLGLLNVYLYGSILGLWFKRPEFWFVIGLPTVYFFQWCIRALPRLEILQLLLEWTTDWPIGLWAGFGLVGFERGGQGLLPILPGLDVVLMWTVLLAAGIILTSRVHRQD